MGVVAAGVEMMMVRVHGRRLGGMTCVDILAAESGGMAGLNVESRHLLVSVVRWDDQDRE